MGILDKLKKPFGGKKQPERITTPKDINGDLPEDLAQFKQRPTPAQPARSGPTNPMDDIDADSDMFLGVPGGPAPKPKEDSPPQQNFMPQEFGLSDPKLANHQLEKPVQPVREQQVRENLDSSHRFELILSKLDTIDARLRVIEERIRRR